jgi:hypothetical protein
MSTGKDPHTETFEWYVEPDHEPGPGGRELSRARRAEERENSLGIIITTSLLFVLFASALMVGGHAAIGPLLRSANAARNAAGNGDVVYTMPDGTFCRHMSIDNLTGEISGGAVERCASRIGDERPLGPSRFEWGGRQ